MPGGAPELSPREVADVIGGHLSAGTGSVTITHLASVERLSRGYPEAGSAVVVVPSAQELSRLAAAPALPGLLVLGEDESVRIAPEMGRTVIFATSATSWHGHPIPTTHRWRKSIAAYFFSPEPAPGFDEPRSTVWL